MGKIAILRTDRDPVSKKKKEEEEDEDEKKKKRKPVWVSSFSYWGATY